MSDISFGDLIDVAMSSIVNDFCFSIKPVDLTRFLDHYGFDDSMRLRSRLVSLCAKPVDIYGFAFAVYVLSGNDCKLQTQKDIVEALIAYKRNNFTF